MPIDVSKLGNNFKSLHGTSLYKPLSRAGHNHISSKSVPKPLSIDLSALKQQDIKTTTATPESKSEPSEESKDYINWNDINEIDSDNKVDDFEEYDYPQPLRIVPHNVYYVWSPETPGYDALTDFLHEEYKTSRMLSNGKRDNELFTSDDWVDNEIPIFPEMSPLKTQPVLCSYRLHNDYGISCSQLMTLIAPQTHHKDGNHIVKRNMFLSKGWGPSGSYINMPTKLESNTIAAQVNLKKLLNSVKANQVVSKSETRKIAKERTDKQATNSRRWSVPHLFVSY